MSDDNQLTGSGDTWLHNEPLADNPNEVSHVKAMASDDLDALLKVTAQANEIRRERDVLRAGLESLASELEYISEHSDFCRADAGIVANKARQLLKGDSDVPPES